MNIIFITRSWHGTGGMQRLSRDLARCMTEEYGERAIIIHPRSRGIVSLAAFTLRALMIGMRYGKTAQVHLGDASLVVLGVIIQKFTGATLSVTACGLDVLYPKRWYQRMIRMFLPQADRVCAISTATADAVQRRGVMPERIVVIPCGVWTNSDREERTVSERGPQLITVGRLIPRKGVAWFVREVLPLLIRQFPDLQYHIVGDGPDAALVHAAMDDRRLSQHVHMHGACSDAERDALLLQSDVFVMPNVSIHGDMEGFGIVCIEAAKLGVMIAASRLQGITDAVKDGETGLFFEPGNAVDCVRVITQLLTHPLPRAAIIERTEKEFGWMHLFARYVHEVF